MRKEKPYVGPKVRQLRAQRGWTLERCAAELGISPSYLSQIETNQRPLTSRALMAVLQAFDVEATLFEPTIDQRLTADLQEACFALTTTNEQVPLSELRRVAQAAPTFARQFLDLQRAYRELDERLKVVDQAVGSAAGPDTSPVLPYDEVSDFFHYRNNYIHDLDLAAEALAAEIGFSSGIGLEFELERYLCDRFDVSVVRTPSDTSMRQYDRATRTVILNASQPNETRAFQLAVHIVADVLAEVIASLIATASFRTREASDVCRVALANYAAAALVMPYGVFARAARQARHDIEKLSITLGVSLEQVCHRLSTMQRPSLRGVPMYFLRMDPAGNITKRHSATRFHFARFGGTCPLWNVHEAASSPDRFVVQVAETPDGIRYLCVARSIFKPSGSFTQPGRRYVLGFGCELSHASELVYGDLVELNVEPVRIGSSCRMCERTDCLHRAFPPLGRRISVPGAGRSVVPFEIECGEAHGKF